MYWTDWKKSSVFLADKDHGAGVTTVASNLSNLMDVKVFAHSVQEGTNACANQTVCTHLCVGMPQGAFRCLCPDALVQRGNECLCPSQQKPLANGTCAAGKYLQTKVKFFCLRVLLYRPNIINIKTMIL